MSNKGYKIRNPYLPHFVTFTVVGWVDIFTRRQCRDILIDNLKYCIAHKGLLLYGYVVMSNHLHAIMAVEENTNGLSYFIRDFKSYTSKQLMNWMLSTNKESRVDWMTSIFQNFALKTYTNDSFQIWTHYNHPVIVTEMDIFNQKLNYIHNNPVKAGIVRKPEDYLYSSASNYAGFKDNLLDVIIVDHWSNIGLIR